MKLNSAQCPLSRTPRNSKSNSTGRHYQLSRPTVDEFETWSVRTSSVSERTLVEFEGTVWLSERPRTEPGVDTMCIRNGPQLVVTQCDLAGNELN